MTRPHVLVVGGGAIGLSLTWELLRRGNRVTVVERDRVGRGTSWAATGILPPARLDTSTDPLDRLRGLSHELFPKWMEQLRRDTGIDPGFRRCGGWYLAETPGERAAMIGIAEYWRELGIACEPRSAERLSRQEPELAAWAEASPDASAWWAPDECQVRSPDLLRALEVVCDQQGARWLLGSAVRDVRDVSGRAEVFVDGRWHRGDAVVLCGGAWSGLIAERLRLEQSLIPVRGQILLLKPERPPLKSVVNLGNRYLVCRDDGHTLVGSVEEEVGFRPGTTPEVVEALHAFACRLVPRLAGATVERSWSGFRPMTFDGFPMIGRVPETERLYVAAGHFRSGIHLSCATAVTLADLILGRSPAIDLDPFRVGKQQRAAIDASHPPS